MSAEPKPFASLSSGLLARKGAARPAMRPQGFGQMGAGLEDLGWNDLGFEPPKPAESPARDDDHDAFGEDLPVQPLRNPLAALTPVASPVHDQQAEIADRLTLNDHEEVDEEFDETAELYEPEAEVETPVVAEAAKAPTVHPVVARIVPTPAPRRASRPRSAPGTKGKAAFTLRLDPERHLKLRLACAVNGQSAQHLVTDALDALLGTLPGLEEMAAKAKRKG
ncbi:MAG TPA: hypothetical protein VFK50_07625 [Sphingomicrobium sp.]|nr:hypothetical protein [Sphingomicrobium sp.]